MATIVFTVLATLMAVALANLAGAAHERRESRRRAVARDRRRRESARLARLADEPDETSVFVR